MSWGAGAESSGGTEVQRGRDLEGRCYKEKFSHTGTRPCLKKSKERKARGGARERETRSPKGSAEERRERRTRWRCEAANERDEGGDRTTRGGYDGGEEGRRRRGETVSAETYYICIDFTRIMKEAESMKKERKGAAAVRHWKEPYGSGPNAVKPDVPTAEPPNCWDRAHKGQRRR